MCDWRYDFMEMGDRYKCKKCNFEIEVIRSGNSIPICCGEEMQKVEDTKDNPIKIKMRKKFEEIKENLLELAEFKKDTFFKKTVLTGEFSDLEIICLKDGQISPEHTHKDLEHILIVLEGEGQVRYANEKYDVKMGDVILIPAGEKHGLISLKDTQFILASINSPKLNSG